MSSRTTKRVGAGNIATRSRDRGRADTDAQNDENAIKNSIRSSLAQTKGNLQADFLGRGASWKKLQIAMTDPPPPSPAEQSAHSRGAIGGSLSTLLQVLAALNPRNA